MFTSNYELRRAWLDDRMMELMHLDDAIKLGRIQGETMGLSIAYGYTHKKYERTPEYRLMRHYLREYRRWVRQHSR